MVKILILLILTTLTAHAQMFTFGTGKQSGSAAPSVGNYYVGGAGASDSNPGTSISPFATITKAGQVAVADDIIVIRAGTYRETIAPTNSGTTGHPITYVADDGATVIISGTNQVETTWEVNSGQIYRTTISLGAMFTEYMTGFNKENLQYNNTQMLAQQIFKGNEAQQLAAYPKAATTTDLLTRGAFRSTVNTPNFGPTSINDAGFAPYGSLTNGVVTINGWFITATRTITSHTSNTINYSTTFDGGDHAFSQFYRVHSRLGLLTQEGEYFYDGTTLYYWQPGGGSPTGVEYKARNWGFDLRNKSNITIEGLQFVGCDPVMTTTSSTNITIDNIRASYMNFHLLESNGGQDGYNDSNVQTGTKLLGTGSILKNSEFNYASGVTVWAGSGVTIQNNKFENGGYGGFYPGFVKLYYSGTSGTTNVKILNNTFSRSGRGAIELTANQSNCTHTGLEIAYNDFSGYNALCVDGGAIYGARKTILTNCIIHHNYFHNSGFDEAGTGQQRGIQTDLYFDQSTGGAHISFNIFVNSVSGSGRSGAYSGDFYTQLWWIENDVYAVTPSKLYNNTFIGNTGGGQYSYVTFAGEDNTDAGAISYPIYEVQRNNIYSAGIVVNWTEPGDVANSVLTGTNPLFTGGTGASQYQLQSGSPARGIGTASISGLYAGSPAPHTDSGALCFGCSVPTYGYVPVVP